LIVFDSIPSKFDLTAMYRLNELSRLNSVANCLASLNWLKTISERLLKTVVDVFDCLPRGITFKAFRVICPISFIF